MTKEIIDYLFLKLETLTTPASEIIMNQIPVEIWLNQMWIGVFVGLVILFLALTIISFIRSDGDDPWIFGYILGIVFIITFSIGIFYCIAELKQLELNPKYHMAEKLINKMNSSD